MADVLLCRDLCEAGVLKHKLTMNRLHITEVSKEVMMMYSSWFKTPQVPGRTEK